MFATNVRNLKKNPSLALRQAEQAPVLVLNSDSPRFATPNPRVTESIILEVRL